MPYKRWSGDRKSDPWNLSEPNVKTFSFKGMISVASSTDVIKKKSVVRRPNDKTSFIFKYVEMGQVFAFSLVDFHHSHH